MENSHKADKRIFPSTAAARLAFCAAAAGASLLAFAAKRPGADGIEKYDPRMAAAEASGKGLEWIDGRDLPLEGKAFPDTSHWYDRLPANVSGNVNAGVRKMKHHTAGMQFRFSTDSKRLCFKWTPLFKSLAMDHMPATGASGIDVYRFDGEKGKWVYVKTGRIGKAAEGSLEIPWIPGAPCLVNLPLYNGIKKFSLGVEKGSSVKPLPPRKSGIAKPVVFYGTSITHGGCASRPGMSFVNIVGRELDVPVVNLGFSGSGVMEYEMSEHLAAIDASCYVLDCLWNMGSLKGTPKKGRNVEENYEKFIRNLRAKRPGVPIVMAGMCDVYRGEENAKDVFVRDLFAKLKAEGWKDLILLPKAGMYTDCEGTVDGVHPNDWGMMSMAKAYGGAVAEALRSGKGAGK